MFSIEDQHTLLEVLKKINKSESFFIMTNAHHNVIKEIFGEFNLYEEDRKSLIGGKNALRQTVSEYVVTNFKIKGKE